MQFTSKQSIRQMATLVSTGLAHDETRFASEMNFKLRGLISQNREKAAGGQKGLNKNLATSTKATKTGLKAADHIAGVVSVASPQGALKKFTTLAQDVHDIKVDNQIVQKSKLYKDYFPTDEMLLLFSTLIMLTVAHRGFVEAKENPGISLGKIRDRLLGKKEDEIDTMVDLEVDKIWGYFDELVCNPEKYAGFHAKAWAGKVRDLFSVCELGDPKDPIGIHNNYAINELWLNLFAYYLQREDKDVKQSVILHLQSIVKVVADMQVVSETFDAVTKKQGETIKQREEVVEEITKVMSEICRTLKDTSMVGRAKNRYSKKKLDTLYKKLNGLEKTQDELQAQLDKLKEQSKSANEQLTEIKDLNGKLEDLLKPIDNIENAQPTRALYLKYPSVEAPCYSPQFFVRGSLAELACITDNEEAYGLLSR